MRQLSTHGRRRSNSERILNHAIETGQRRGVGEQNADGYVRVPGCPAKSVRVPVELQSDLVHELEGLLQGGADVAHIVGAQVLELVQEGVFVRRLVPADAHAAIPRRARRTTVSCSARGARVARIGRGVLVPAGNQHEVVLVAAVRIAHALDKPLDSRLGVVEQRHAEDRALVHGRARVDHKRHQHDLSLCFHTRTHSCFPLSLSAAPNAIPERSTRLGTKMPQHLCNVVHLKLKCRYMTRPSAHTSGT